MKVKVLAFAMALAMAGVACSNASSGGGGGSGQTQGVSATEIRVGGMASLTGPLGDQYAPIFDGAQAYFDCMRPQFGANTREKLQKYDPDLFALVDEVYKQSKFRYVRYDRRFPPAGKEQPERKQEKKD